MLVVLAVLVTSITVYARSGYFIEVEGDTMVIYQGRSGGVLWFDPTAEDRIEFDPSLIDSDALAVRIEDLDFDALDEAEAFANDLLEQADSTAP